jgi:allantoinase
MSTSTSRAAPIGRVRHRDAGGGGRWRHDGRRHAAEQRAGDDDRGGAGGQADRARGQCHVDVAFWGGVVPGNAAYLDQLVEAGVRGFKCFLVPSGVDEFPAVDERDLRDALPILSRRRVPLLVHAEAPALIQSPSLRSDRDSRASARQAEAAYRTYLVTRPPEAEVDAIRTIARLAREFAARVHIVHVASAEAADEVARAKADGVAITAETCRTT